MEQEKIQNVEPETTVEKQGEEVKGTETEEVVKTFTQEEVNSMVEAAKAKVKKTLPDKDTFKRFKEWEDSQKTSEQKAQELKLEEAKNISRYQESLVKSKIANTDQADYITWKVQKMEGDFLENLDEFLTTNPQYLKTAEVKPETVNHPRVTVDDTVKHSEYEERFKKDYGYYPNKK